MGCGNFGRIVCPVCDDVTEPCCKPLAKVHWPCGYGQQLPDALTERGQAPDPLVFHCTIDDPESGSCRRTCCQTPRAGKLTSWLRLPPIAGGKRIFRLWHGFGSTIAAACPRDGYVPRYHTPRLPLPFSRRGGGLLPRAKRRKRRAACSRKRGTPRTSRGHPGPKRAVSEACSGKLGTSRGQARDLLDIAPHGRHSQRHGLRSTLQDPDPAVLRRSSLPLFFAEWAARLTFRRSGWTRKCILIHPRARGNTGHACTGPHGCGGRHGSDRLAALLHVEIESPDRTTRLTPCLPYYYHFLRDARSVAGAADRALFEGGASMASV